MATNSNPAAGDDGARQGNSSGQELPATNSPNPQALSNSLADLAERVRSAQEAATIAEQTTIEKSIEAGQLLVQAKGECRHGQWLIFLKRAGIGERWAQMLMKLARSGIKSELVRILGGVRPATEFLDRHRLPPAGYVLFLSLAAIEKLEPPLILIWPAAGYAGYFHSVGFTAGFEATQYTARPVNADTEAGRSCLWAGIALTIGLEYFPDLQSAIFRDTGPAETLLNEIAAFQAEAAP